MNVLVTGGAGYIGSHVIDDLIKSGYTPIVYDNFSTGHAEAVPETVQLIQGDLHDFTFLKHIMGQYEIDAVLHFAASSQVGESMVDPGKYYYNNVAGTLGLLDAMRESGVEYIRLFVDGGRLRGTGPGSYYGRHAPSSNECLWPDKTHD